MKKGLLLAAVIVAAFTACQKEYSLENGGDTSGTIIGADCRISKIAYADSATGTGIGSISATIDASDNVNDITQFDSLTLTIDQNRQPQYFGDTVYIDADEYYIFDATTKRINSFHGLIDPTVPGSTEFDIAFNYDAAGYLLTKSYTYTGSPNVPYQMVTYTYSGGNLTHMETDDLYASQIIKSADLSYNTTISPKNYIYLFPDENTYPEVNQFFNFGNKSTNAIQNLKVNYYTSGVVTDSTVSHFSSYILSRDNYVTSVYMIGDDQSTIPAAEGKLTFSYHCK